MMLSLGESAVVLHFVNAALTSSGTMNMGGGGDCSWITQNLSNLYTHKHTPTPTIRDGAGLKILRGQDFFPGPLTR